MIILVYLVESISRIQERSSVIIHTYYTYWIKLFLSYNSRLLVTSVCLLVCVFELYSIYALQTLIVCGKIWHSNAVGRFRHSCCIQLRKYHGASHVAGDRLAETRDSCTPLYSSCKLLYTLNRFYYVNALLFDLL